MPGNILALQQNFGVAEQQPFLCAREGKPRKDAPGRSGFQDLALYLL